MGDRKVEVEGTSLANADWRKSPEVGLKTCLAVGPWRLQRVYLLVIRMLKMSSRI